MEVETIVKETNATKTKMIKPILIKEMKKGAEFLQHLSFWINLDCWCVVHHIRGKRIRCLIMGERLVNF